MTTIQVNRKKKPNWGIPNLGPYSHVKDLADEYVCVRNWMLNLGKRTRKNYKMYMRRFMHFSGWDPDQILEQAKQDRPQSTSRWMSPITTSQMRVPFQ